MYLAREFNGHQARYYLRESYRDEHVYRHRELFDLGPDPSRFIIYPGGNAYYFSEHLEDALRAEGIPPPFDSLDDLLWPFLKPDIRRALAHFRGRGTPPARSTAALSAPPAHAFDRRRYHFLRYGQIDQRGLAHMPPRFFLPVTGRSRDEIEQRLMDMERELRPLERKTYVYVAFNLQQHFQSPLATRFPSAMDPERLDAALLEAVCRLHGDSGFWAGYPRGETLHPYLVRYLIMFYDYEFQEADPMRQYMHDFMNRRRHQRFMNPAPKMNTEEICKLLHIEPDALREMSRRELTRKYRQVAMESHPDRGGSHEAFIRVTEAYRSALKKTGRSGIG